MKLAIPSSPKRFSLMRGTSIALAAMAVTLLSGAQALSPASAAAATNEEPALVCGFDASGSMICTNDDDGGGSGGETSGDDGQSWGDDEEAAAAHEKALQDQLAWDAAEADAAWAAMGDPAATMRNRLGRIAGLMTECGRLKESALNWRRKGGSLGEQAFEALNSCEKQLGNLVKQTLGSLDVPRAPAPPSSKGTKTKKRHKKAGRVRDER